MFPLSSFMGQLTGIASTSLFNPADLTPVAWYDFSDASLLFTDAGITPVSGDGDAIYQANDKSVSGLHLTQTTLGARAAYKTAIQNGLSIARFDGVDDWLMNNSAAINGSTNRTEFIVSKPGSSGSVKAIAALGFSGNFRLDANTAEIATRVTAGNIVFNSAASLIKQNIIVKRLDGTLCSDITTQLDGVALSQASINDQTLNTGDGITIGASFADNTITIPAVGSFQDQDFCERILYPYALTDSQIAQVVSWLNKKWSAY